MFFCMNIAWSEMELNAKFDMKVAKRLDHET